MRRLLTFAGLVVAGQSMAIEFGPGAGFTFPDNSAVGGGSNINVAGQLPFIASLNWVKVSFGTTTTAPNRMHTWVGDLIVVFSHVGTGTSVHLFSRVGSTTATGIGDSSDLSGPYRFFETGASFAAAAGTVAGGVPVPNGDYARSTHAFGAGAGNSGVGVPQFNANTYANFTGLATNGDWRLFITDNAGGDVGDVTAWSFDATLVPEPATLAVLGIGALALLRRRRK